MKTAIIGLPMVGKTSLFTILTGVHEATRVGLMETRVGVSKVPDTRLEELAELFEPPKVTYATVEYLDFPSISKEALREASYLAGLRVVDALAHVLRIFESDTVPHEKGSVDPLRDAEDVEIELILSDLVVVEKRLERLEKDRKKIKNPELDHEWELLERAKAQLENNQSLRNMELSADDEKRIRGFQFLSLKPMLYVLNLGEEDAPRLHEREIEYRDKLTAGRPRTAVTAVCGKIEAELAELPPAEARDYMASYGLKESGLERLISATYALLGLMSFLTAGETEVRAWTIPIDSTAQKAAGAIHSDFEKKFIRAEVVNWRNLVDLKGYPGVREKGLLRLEGKEYIVKDGDVLVRSAMGDLGDLATKAQRLLELHHQSKPLVIGNAWDAASARVFEAEGFAAIGTSSAGVAFAMGYPDGQRIPRQEMIAAVRRIAAAVQEPVTADVEAAYAVAIEDVVETARQVMSAGAVGMNLEDVTGDDETSLFDIDLQCQKIRAIRSAAESFRVHLVLNARTEIFLKGIGDPATRFERAIERLRAYADSGADCLFAPGVRDAATIRRLVEASPKPLNILAVDGTPPLAELRRLGVARVSIGSGAMRASLGLVRRIARELIDRGEYSAMIDGAIPFAEANRLMDRRA